LRSAGVGVGSTDWAAIELVVAKRDRDGFWPLEARYPGVTLVEMDEGEAT